jgi:hypothetical protein
MTSNKTLAGRLVLPESRSSQAAALFIAQFMPMDSLGFKS